MAATTTEAPLRGSRGEVFDLEAAPAARRSRVPELALGLLLVVGGALGGLVWQLSATRTTPVLAVARPVQAGEVIELTDLNLVEVRIDGDANVLVEAQARDLVGRVARTDLVPGTLLTLQHVAETSVFEAGDGQVGLLLAPGGYPSLQLSPGATVDVVLMPGPGEAGELIGGAAALTSIGEQILVESATVSEVDALGGQGQLFVGLVMSESEAALVARAASAGRVRLVEVAGEGGS